MRLEPVIVIHNGLAGVYAANVKIYKADKNPVVQQFVLTQPNPVCIGTPGRSWPPVLGVTFIRLSYNCGCATMAGTGTMLAGSTAPI